MDNNSAKKLVHKALDPVMRANGFSRVDRTYYKRHNELIFVMQTHAVGNFFSSVTGWPSHSFNLLCGVWVEYISPYVKWEETAPHFPKKKDKTGEYVPNARLLECEKMNDFERTSENAIAGLGEKLGVSQLEASRKDLWIITDDEKENADALSELLNVSLTFIEKCKCLENQIVLKSFLLDEKREQCLPKFFENDKIISFNTEDKHFLLLKPYLQYATLYYKRHGAKGKFSLMLIEYEKWVEAYNQSAYAKSLKINEYIPKYCYE